MAGVLLIALAACRSAPTAGSRVSWADGPVRWLMMPWEEREVRRLNESRDIVRFMEDFWQRRDPDPSAPGNPFLATFYERVQAADRLYGEGSVRGSLTDRGRALVLLGPPPILRHLQRPAAGWRPGQAGNPPAREQRSVTVEEWEYPESSLPERLASMLAEDGASWPVTLTFVLGARRAYLIEGEKILELSAQAALP